MWPRLHRQRPSQEDLRQRVVMRQWRKLQSPFNPFNWPLLLHRFLSRRRSLAVIRAAARNARMASLLAARRRRRQTANAMPLASARNALRRKVRHFRRHCRVQMLRLQTRLLRFLVVQLLNLALWLLLQSLPLWFPALLQRLCHGRKRF